MEGDKFTDFRSAAQRSCDRQFTACSQAANQEANKGVLRVGDCDDQKGEHLFSSLHFAIFSLLFLSLSLFWLSL